MAKPILSKSGLQKERENLRLYRKVLPSLDLKRQQLLGEQKRAEREYQAIHADFAPFVDAVAKELPMLGADAVNLSHLVRVKQVHIRTENVVGVRLPALESVEFEPGDYPLLGKPHWVDTAVERLREFAELKARHDIAGQRVAQLAVAARKITQRVNLFDKILIPTAKENIRKIQVYLADAERAAVVQSKLAKMKARQARKAAAASAAVIAKEGAAGA